MPVPIVYRKSGEQVIANYNFIDLVSGRGILTLYGYDYKIGDTTSYGLTSNQIYSQAGVTQTTASTQKFVDYRLKFDKSVTVDGTLTFTIPFRVQNAAGETVSMAIILKTLSGTSETTVLTTSGAIVTPTANPWPSNFVLKVPVNKFKIKDNDELIMNVRYQSPPKTIDWFHDPKNRATINSTAYVIENSSVMLDLPIVIDL